VNSLQFFVSTGKAKEAIGIQLTHSDVKRLSDKDVQKNTKRYKSFVGPKTIETLIDSVLMLATKAVNRFLHIKDIDALQKALKDDYIINKELSALSGNTVLKCGRVLADANVALITTKHVDFSAEQPKPEQSSATAE